jgi:hypothetical protein
MAIQFIDNQPLTWRTDWPTDSDCKTPYDRACTLYTTNDYLMAQWKQTPCGNGDNQIVDDDFINANSELVTNGNFTSNATGWTLSGATYDATNKRIQFSAFGQSLEQSGVVSAGNTYDVTFTIGGNTNTSLKLLLGGTLHPTYFNSPGTYTVTMVAGGSNTKIRFENYGLPPAYNGWIDSISVKLNSWSGGDWTTANPTLWLNNGDATVTKVAGTASTLVGTVNTLPAGAYIRIGINVTNMTAGQLDIVTDSSKGSITANGFYYFYDSDYNNDNLTLSANAAFNGTISQVSVVVYSNYFSVVLRDTKGATDYDLSSYLTYDEDWVTLNYQLGSVDPSCYELCFYDACGYDVSEELISDPDFTQAIGGSDWPSSVVTSGSLAITGGKLVLTQSGIPLTAYVEANPTTWQGFAGNTFTVIDYDFTTVLAQYTGFTRIQLYDSATGYELTLVTSPSAGTQYQGTVNWPYTIGNASKLAIRIQSTGTNGTKIELENMSLIVTAYVPGQMAEYCSNCIEILDGDDCTLWVGGSNGSDAFGFHFANNFQVGARVRAMMINPKYKGSNKRYTDADGKYTVTQANTGKIYTLFIDYTDEHTHDWLRVAVLSDTVRIGQFTNTNNYYTSTDGDYEPEWPDTLGNWPAAQARIDMQKQNDELYNNNAG